MDRLEALGSALSQVSIYDIKSYYNQAKNMVLNVSEMEAKVRDATNDEPWGASSTLMQEIAQGTFNFQQFNEIMPCIYARFMDKEARQWREIYKALQLLEYIVKHGSERVVDDARSHLSTIKMLRNFHYIDEKGKDQGINVRNRAKEISELLMDVERIRTERRKAKANRNKYVGTGNDGMSFSGGSGRYGGFGSDSLGSGSRSYGGSGGGSYDRDYGGYSGGGYSGGGSSSSGFRDSAPNQRGFDEYDAGNDEVPAARQSSATASVSRTSSLATRSPGAVPTPTQSAASKAKEVDLLGFMDDDFGSSASAPAPAPNAEKALPALAAPAVNPLDDGDDDFADFQAAPTSPPATATASVAPIASGGLFDVLGATPAAAAAPPPQYAMQRQTVQPVQSAFGANTFAPLSPTASRTSLGSPTPTSPQPMGMGMGMQMNTTMAPSAPSYSAKAPLNAGRAPPAAKSASSAGGFDDLWNLSLGTSKPSTPVNNGSAKKSIKDLEKEKSQASIWGGSAGASFGGVGPSTGAAPAPAQSSSGGFDDLLL